MSKKREFPILNGKLISDLDANGFKILGADIEVPAEKIKEAVAPELEAKADKTALEAEAQRATGVEATLGNAIAAETQRAQEAEAALREGKVDKVSGKGLSANDYTDAEKSKLAGIAAGAQVNPTPIAPVNATESGMFADAYWTQQDLAGKADKVANATSGNLAALDENGNLVDSGNMVAGAFTARSFIGGDGGQVGFQLNSASEGVELYVNDGGGKILKFPLREGTLAVQDDIAPTFDETDTYDKGALVFHDGLYQCVNPNGHIGAWVAADFAVATVEDVLAALRRTVEGKVDKEAGKGLSTNDYTNEDREKLGTAYTPANPPPAPDLSGYATNDAALPRYQFTSAGIIDGVVTIPPYVYAGMLSDGTAFTVAVGEGNGYMRDCILCVQCGDVAPTITWTTNFHPRTDAETDFACVAGVNNVYWISEYVQGEFVVAGWQATAGGSAQ